MGFKGQRKIQRKKYTNRKLEGYAW